MSDANCRAQLPQVTENMQHSGAEVRLVLAQLWLTIVTGCMGTIDHQVVFRQIVELVRSGVGVVKSIRHSHVAQLWRC